MQIIFHKRATKYRSLLQKMTYKHKGSYESSPPCTENANISMHMKRAVVTACLHNHVDSLGGSLENHDKKNPSNVTLVLYDVGLQNVSAQWI